MFDWKRIRQRTWKQAIKGLLVLSLPLLFLLYGLKVAVTEHGRMIVHIRTPGEFTMQVTGRAAVMSGLADIGLGLFVILSCGGSQDERHPWIFRFARGILQWSGVAAAAFCTLEARRLAGLGSFGPNGPSYGLPKLIFLAALPFLLLLGFFFAILYALALMGRRAIKQDLYKRELELIQIRARPLSYWGRGLGLAFVVKYMDRQGFVHRAVCFVSGRRTDEVTWFKDELEVIDV